MELDSNIVRYQITVFEVVVFKLSKEDLALCYFWFSESLVLSKFESLQVKGVFSKPSGNLILGPDVCLLS